MTPQMQSLATALVHALTPHQRSVVRRIIDRGGRVTEDHLSQIPALIPLCARADGGRVVADIYVDALRSGLEAAILPEDPLGAVIEDALAGRYDAAIGALDHNAGVFASMTRGIDMARTIANAFPDHMAGDRLTVGLLNTVNALKSGNLSKADALIAGLARNFDVPDLATCDASHDPTLVCVLFMKAVYSDAPVPDAALQSVFGVLADLPPDASLMRGVLYNVVLDVLLRRNRIAMADEAAHRALFHYRAANEAGLEFYVQLYLAIIAIWSGDLDQAPVRIDAARAALDRARGATPNDTLLLRYVALICAYEAGDASGVLDHLTGDGDSVLFGELWPALAEPILSYGRSALASETTRVAALSWVRRWRLRQWRSQRFDDLISAQEAIALQDLGRWQEADEVLSRLPQGAHGAVQIARFASALDRAPASEELARTLRSALELRDQSTRHRLMLWLMLAQSAVNRGAEGEAARVLEQAVTEAGPDHLPKFWHEQRRRVDLILRSRALREELRRMPQLRRALDAVTASDATAIPSGVTRQEYRVLLLLSEGLPNKMIAQRLGVSLPTAKFHVRNLCRKTQTPDRKSAVRAAINLGWLPSH